MRTTRRGRDAAATEPGAGPSRHTHAPRRRLRNRLLGAVLVTLVAVPAAGAPSVATAVHDLSQSQRLLRLTELNTSAVALSHALSDERGEAAARVAAGPAGSAPDPDERTDVDRQVGEVAHAASALDTGGSPDLVRVTGNLRIVLGGLDRIRHAADAAGASPRSVFDSYTPVIDALDAVSGAVARALPDRAADPDTSAGPALARAVTDASAERGLLVAALSTGGTAGDLVGEARTEQLREQAAFADFTAAATADARTRYAQTVTGSDVAAADHDLRELTAASQLTYADRRMKTTDVDRELAARIDRMRAVQSSLAAADTTRLTSLRDADVTALEVRGALVALCTLVALGIGVQTARSVTRPLAAVRRYAADPSGRPPTGSADEFAALALDVEHLAREAQALRERGAEQAAEREREQDLARSLGEDAASEQDLLRQREARLREEQRVLAREKEELAARLESLRGSVHGTFVHLSLRTLALIDRQLRLIEDLENREQDPEELRTLFRLDHLATRMRRNSESLLVLAGAETGGGTPARPVPLVDVVRAGVSEIERYERVRIPFLPRAQVAGFAADDAGHVIAELLENATSFSPPDSAVQVSGWVLENGEVVISVEDRGIGVPADRLEQLNLLLGDPRPDETETRAGLGLYVVARLAGRHRIRVRLRAGEQGGVAAVVVLPKHLLADPDGPGPHHEAGPARPEPSMAGAHRTAVPAPAPAAPGRRPAAAGPRYTGQAPQHAAEPDPAAQPARPRPGASAPTGRHAPQDPPGRPAGPPPGGELPKRVPRSSGLTGEPAAREHGVPVDADTLRRRLGGFAQGLRQGRMDAEAEATGRPYPARGPLTAGDHSDSEPSEEARG